MSRNGAGSTQQRNKGDASFPQHGPQKRKFTHGPSLTQRLNTHITDTADYGEARIKKSHQNKNVTNEELQKRSQNQLVQKEVTSLWNDSEDEGISLDKDENTGETIVTTQTINLLRKNKDKKLRAHRGQETMENALYIQQQRESFESTFTTPEWAQIDSTKISKEKQNEIKLAMDKNKTSKADKLKELRRITGQAGDSDDEDEVKKEDALVKNEDDALVKKEEIKQEFDTLTPAAKKSKAIKSLLAPIDGTANNTNDEDDNEKKSTSPTVFELQYEDQETIRDQFHYQQVDALSRLEDIFSTTKKLKGGHNDGSGEKKGRGTGTLTNHSLRPTRLYIDRIADANANEISYALLTSTGFHNNNQLLFTAGMDTTLKLFQLDGINNPCVQSLAFEDFSIYRANFINNQQEILCTGRRGFLQVVDLVTSTVTKIKSIRGRKEKSWEYWVPSPCSKFIAFLGDDSSIVIIDAVTKYFIGEIRTGQSQLGDLSWSLDSKYIFAIGADGFVYSFSVGQRQQLFSFRDNGAARGTALSFSDNGKWLASGSNNGIVNIYDTDFSSLLQSNQHGATVAETGYDIMADSFSSYYGSYNSYNETKNNIKLPYKELTSLTTKIEHLKWSPSNEILAVSSRVKKDQLRLIHVPTFTVFQNWPTDRTPFSYIQDVAFSPDNTKIAIANDKGRVLLYSIDHYRPYCNLD